MVARDDLRDDELIALKRRVEKLERVANTGFTSITRGALRVASVEGLIVEGSQRVSGVLVVTGEERVDGVLRVSGTLIVSGDTQINGPTAITGNTSVTGRLTVAGPMDITGETNISGPTGITGTFTVDGDTTISGDVSLTGDFTVSSGGRIVIDGGVEIGQNGSGVARVAFGGSEIRGGDGGIVLDPGSGASLSTSASGFRIFSLPLDASLNPNLHITSTGYMFRTS